MEIDSNELRVVLDSAPVGISLVSIDRTVRYCNPAFAETYGWSPEELIGRRLPLPEHQKEHWNDLLDQLRRGERFRNVETVRVRKDGSEFYTKISGTPVFDRMGKLDAVVGFADATEDNHSDQLELRSLEYLVQSTTDFMCVADLTMKTVFINDPGRRMIGLGQDQDIDGTFVFDFFSEGSRQRIAAAAESLTSMGASLSFELGLRHVVSGDSIPVSCSIYLMRDPHTLEPVSFTFVAHNLSSLQLLELEADQHQSAFAFLFRSVPVAVALVNPSGYLIDSNEAFRAMLGYSAQEMMTVPLARFVHPEDLTAGRGLFLDLLAGKIESYKTGKRLVHKEGYIFQVHLSVSLIRGPHGEPKHSISIVQRVSEESVRGDFLTPSDTAGNFPSGAGGASTPDCCQ